MQYFHKGSFTHHNFSRLDVDECVDGTDECDASSTTCRNTPGSHTCICKNGYENIFVSSSHGPKCTGNNIYQVRDFFGPILMDTIVFRIIITTSLYYEIACICIHLISRIYSYT